jgi:hypothetical protein
VSFMFWLVFHRRKMHNTHWLEGLVVSVYILRAITGGEGSIDSCHHVTGNET